MARSIGRTIFTSRFAGVRIRRTDPHAAAAPLKPVPRAMRSNTVSAWSSTVCATRMASAPTSSAGLGEESSNVLDEQSSRRDFRPDDSNGQRVTQCVRRRTDCERTLRHASDSSPRVRWLKCAAVKLRYRCRNLLHPISRAVESNPPEIGTDDGVFRRYARS